MADQFQESGNTALFRHMPEPFLKNHLKFSARISPAVVYSRAHTQSELLYQGKSNTGAGGLAGKLAFAPVKQLEDLTLLRLRHTRTEVSHVQNNMLGAFFHSQAQLDLFAFCIF